MYGMPGYTAQAAKLLEPYLEEEMGCTQHFDGVPFEVFQQVLETLPEGMAQDERRNCAPALETILKYGNDRWTVGGYLVGPARDDEWVSIDRITVRVHNLDEVSEVMWLGELADEQSLSPASDDSGAWELYVWFD